ncbi:DUF554 family protein [Paenibacillus xylanexedens]|uniref:DUF554 family protein n=1 Tax=Paenibacillus xylanexedens TaxID=528191 RepID=UPI003B022AD5
MRYKLVSIPLGTVPKWTTKSFVGTKIKSTSFFFLTLGAIIGQLINFENLLSNIMTKSSSNGLNEGLTVAISLLCVGSIPILGPLQSALQGDNTFFCKLIRFSRALRH